MKGFNSEVLCNIIVASFASGVAVIAVLVVASAF